VRPATVRIDGRVSLTVPGPVTVATDASRLPGGSSWYTTGYVATTGQFGLHAVPSPEIHTGRNDMLVTELRALARAAAVINPYGEGPVTFLTDSQAAAGFAAGWLRGGQDFPDGYRLTRNSGSQPILVILAQLLAASPGLYRVEWVTGHTGHPLNETADSLARLAARTAQRQFGKGEAERIAGQYVTATLEAIIASR
jgi:ribonuclease HI